MRRPHRPRRILARNPLPGWGTVLPVPTWTLSEIQAAVRSSWGPETLFAPADSLARGSGQSSRGQCGTTALVIQDQLGGDLMIADVEYEGRVERGPQQPTALDI